MAYAASDPRIRNYKVSSMRSCGQVTDTGIPGQLGGIMFPGNVAATTWGMGGSGPTAQGIWVPPPPTIMLPSPTGYGGT
jgi:hypothetical protein